jgi:sec-independent protein translocase protein TatA
MEALTPWHLVLILIGFVVLFGYKKLPDASRSLGRSLRIFKTEVHAMSGDDASERREGAGPVATAASSHGVAELEAEAAAAEARAAELRERAQAHASRRGPAA